MRYAVSSTDLLPTFHRKLANAHHEACQRLNVAESEVVITDYRTNRQMTITVGTTKSQVEEWLTWGVRGGQ